MVSIKALDARKGGGTRKPLNVMCNVCHGKELPLKEASMLLPDNYRYWLSNASGLSGRGE